MKDEIENSLIKDMVIEWVPRDKKEAEYLKSEGTRPNFNDFEICKIKFDVHKNWRIKQWKNLFLRLCLPAGDDEDFYELNAQVLKRYDDEFVLIVKKFTDFSYNKSEFEKADQNYWNVGPSDRKIYEWRDACFTSLKRVENISQENEETLHKDIVEKILGKRKLSLHINYRFSIYFKKYEDKLKNINEFQQEAAINALENNFTLIQGPPGTGKTTTSTAILDLLGEEMENRKTKISEKILVLADSNKAVDNLTLKMMDKGLKVLRIMSLSAQKSDYDPKLNKVCYHFLKKKKPNYEVENYIKEVKYFCCTLDRAIRLEKIPEFNYFKFPYSLVDEATQCQELQTMKAISRDTEKFILVGDQCQLGPVFKSTEAKKFDISSTFERLVTQEKGNDWVKLLEQYRMNSKISDISSKLFYKGEIKTGVNDADREKYKKYPDIFKSRPIIFYHVKGEERRQRDSYSNNAEKELVKEILLKFSKNQFFDFKNLAIISNYSSQIYNLKSDIKKLRDKELYENLEIDTVDAFQGREKDFIIISTVRSNSIGKVGFLSDSRRMNVGITRAKHGVVIIGDMDTLNNEPKWKMLIKILQKQKCLFYRDGWSDRDWSLYEDHEDEEF